MPNRVGGSAVDRDTEEIAVTTTQADNLANVPYPGGATRICEWDDVQFGIEDAPLL
jgi:hypothetical protein